MSARRLRVDWPHVAALLQALPACAAGAGAGADKAGTNQPAQHLTFGNGVVCGGGQVDEQGQVLCCASFAASKHLTPGKEEWGWLRGANT